MRSFIPGQEQPSVRSEGPIASDPESTCIICGAPIDDFDFVICEDCAEAELEGDFE
jgi:hypothetical protein